MHIPTPREVDPVLLERLREIDPDAYLIYIGGGVWSLGVLGPTNQARESRASKLIAQGVSSNNPVVVRLGKAAMQGFRQIARYTEADLWSGYILADFRHAEWVYRKNREAAFKRLLAASESGGVQARSDAAREEALYRAKDAWAYVMKGRQHFIPKAA